MAKNNDVVGVVTTTPSITSNEYTYWQGKYEMNEKGQIDFSRVSKDYDPTQGYRPRIGRPEWGLIGMLGQVHVEDDGTCVVGEFCEVGLEGKATHSINGWMVIKRISPTSVKIILK